MKILFEDNHLIAVYKPFNTLTQSDITKDISLLDQTKKYLKEKYHKPGNVYLGLLHRLDRPTAGIILFAKTSKAASRLSKQFREHTITKKYLALVEDKIKVGENKQLINYLSKNPKKNKVKITNQPHPNSKKAILEYESIQINQNYLKLFSIQKPIINSSLLIINLLTGRPHQIRTQISHLGHPILGDLKYGSETLLPKKNIALIAYSLTFLHPVTKKEITIKIDQQQSNTTFYKLL